MQKHAGSDPPHGDWQFVEFARESAGHPFVMDGGGLVCWACHDRAQYKDWVFTPLE